MRPPPKMRRRCLLEMASLALVSGACGEAQKALAPLPPSSELPDRMVGPLADLLSVIELSWALLLRPHRLADTPWLRPALAQVLEDQRLDVLAQTTGVDVREAPELVVARYANDVTLELVRHAMPAPAVERHFRERLTSGERRAELGHQAVSLWGNIGTERHGFVSLGVDVAGFQFGGPEKTGPGRVALLYGLGELEDVPKLLDDEALAAVHALLQASGVPPVEVLFPGPFDGELARGARGLLGASTGVGVSIEPTAAKSLRLVVLIAGDFAADVAKATALLEAAWNDLATADLGHLLSLGEPKVAAKAIAVPLGLALGVELDAELLFRGLRAATSADIDEVMRW